MTPFSELLAQGAQNAWVFIPTAILLGVLHGLEPGHSKTMMAAFIVAVRGTVSQAVLLGVAATLSHTLVVWAIALGGMFLWQGLKAETAEPWLQLVSGIIIIGMALWMAWATWREQKEMKAAAAAADAFRAKAASDLSRVVDTGHGMMAVELPQGAASAPWRIKVLSGDQWQGEYVTMSIERPDGSRQGFTFLDRDGFMESAEPVAAPFDFKARLSLDHGDHEHGFDLAFGGASATPADDEPLDAHARAHADDIRKRFTGRDVTTWQIALFGLTGGLIPCPAAVTVLLLCLQLKEIALGATLVLCFSIGLAITLVSVGVIAALGTRKLSEKSGWFSTVAARAPYFSSALIILAGLYIGWHGWAGIRALQTAGL